MMRILRRYGSWLALLACGPAVAAQPSLVARGHEPDWHLVIGPEGVALRSLAPDLAFTAARVEHGTRDGRPALTASAGERRLSVAIDERLCADTMTGMPFPVGVRLSLDGRELSGCGGETLTVLEGGWRVILMDGRLVPAGTIITIVFGHDGQVSGRGGCNRYSGSFTLTGEGLAFGPAAATRMACPQTQMKTEARFFERLGQVTRVTPGQHRRLDLMAGDRPALVIDRVD